MNHCLKWGTHFDLANKRDRVEELEHTMEEPGFWDDPNKSAAVVQDCKKLKSVIERYEKLCGDRDDILTLIDIAEEENDASLLPEVEESFQAFEDEYKSLRIETLLSGEYDKCNAILTLHAGAGGTESCDWASMLCRMYQRWAEKKGFNVEMIDFLDGDEAGYKSVTLQIDGENAYGYLKSEHGVHRLVRISPFNAAGKRQTSFAMLEVTPELDEDVSVEINPDDLRIDTYRSSGAGGQHINKTSSAIRITHIPTGIVVQCQNERSQHSNKDTAMKMLTAKLFMMKEEENKAKLAGIRGEVTDNGWGSQIRNYVLQPYTMVKDARTGFECSNAQAVLDGGIDGFISAYLKWINTKEETE